MRTAQEMERLSYLREWGFDLAAFEARAKKSIESAHGDFSELTGVLRQSMAKMKQTVLDLQRNRKPVAEELRRGFENAWDEIEKAFTRARQRVRDAKKVPAGGEDLTDDWLG